MKTLILLRHAKASWDQPELSDLERPLKEKGHRQAEKMSAHLREALPAPEHIFCSSSTRTRETLPPFLKAWGLKAKQVSFLDELYLADEQVLLEFVKALPPQLNRVLLLGHNPGLTDLINQLNVRLDNLPTGSAVCFNFNTGKWSEISADNSQFQWLQLAREL